MDSEIEVQRNQAMTISFGEPMIADLFLERRCEVITEPNIFQILELANRPVLASELVSKLGEEHGCSPESAASQLHSLREKGVLTTKVADPAAIQAIRHWEERGWLEAFILHVRSCDLEYADVDPAPDGDGAQSPAEAWIAQIPPDMRARGEISENGVILLNNSTELPSDGSLEEVLLRRRTNGPCRNDHARLDELSAILRWANLKGRQNRESTRENLERDPRAPLIWSSFCCLETFVIASGVESLPNGIYFYDVLRHELILQREGDFRDTVSKICIGQQWPKRATFGLMLVCDWFGYQARYAHVRAYRNLLINAGELAQRYLVAATAFRFGNFLTPALKDQLASELFGLHDGRASPMYSLSFA